MKTASLGCTKKKLKGIPQAAREALIDPRLRGKFPIHINRRVEWIVRRVHIVRQNRGRHAYLIPIVLAKCVGTLLAVETDLPRQNSVLLQHSPVEFRARRIVLARQGGEGKW